jgi:hypothetical protein
MPLPGGDLLLEIIMRIHLQAFVALSCLALVNAPIQAQDTAQIILDKAIAAHGGPIRLAEFKGGRKKVKGTIFKQGGIPFTQETVYQLPGQVKSTETFAVNGRAVVVSTGLDGEKAWMTVNGNFQDLDARTLAELKEGAYLMNVTRLTALKDPSYQLSFLFSDRSVTLIKVVCAGHRDLGLYFDRETDLLVAVKRQTVDPKTGKEVFEERLFSDYQNINGIMVPKKAVIYRDGEKYLGAEMTEVQFLDKLDPSEFAKP